jgi:hypothetical protein
MNELTEKIKAVSRGKVATMADFESFLPYEVIDHLRCLYTAGAVINASSIEAIILCVSLSLSSCHKGERSLYQEALYQLCLTLLKETSRTQEQCQLIRFICIQLVEKQILMPEQVMSLLAGMNEAEEESLFYSLMRSDDSRELILSIIAKDHFLSEMGREHWCTILEAFNGCIMSKLGMEGLKVYLSLVKQKRKFMLGENSETRTNIEKLYYHSIDLLIHTVPFVAVYIRQKKENWDGRLMSTYLSYLNKIDSSHKEEWRQKMNTVLLPAMMEYMPSGTIYDVLNVFAKGYQEWNRCPTIKHDVSSERGRETGKIPMPVTALLRKLAIWEKLSDHHPLAAALLKRTEKNQHGPQEGCSLRAKIVFYMLCRRIMPMEVCDELKTDKALQSEVYHFVKSTLYGRMALLPQLVIKAIFMAHLLFDASSPLRAFLSADSRLIGQWETDYRTQLEYIKLKLTAHGGTPAWSQAFDMLKGKECHMLSWMMLAMVRQTGALLTDELFSTNRDHEKWCDIHLLASILYHAIERGVIGQEAYPLFSSNQLCDAMYVYMQGIGVTEWAWEKKYYAFLAKSGEVTKEIKMHFRDRMGLDAGRSFCAKSVFDLLRKPSRRIAEEILDLLREQDAFSQSIFEEAKHYLSQGKEESYQALIQHVADEEYNLNRLFQYELYDQWKELCVSVHASSREADDDDFVEQCSDASTSWDSWVSEGKSEASANRFSSP